MTTLPVIQTLLLVGAEELVVLDVLDQVAEPLRIGVSADASILRFLGLQGRVVDRSGHRLVVLLLRDVAREHRVQDDVAAILVGRAVLV